MNRKLLICTVIVVIASYVLVTEINNYFDGGLHETSISAPFNDHSPLDDYKEMPEVMAFFAKYNDDAQVSVRADHISYFAGSDDGFRMRMNVFFDENQMLHHIDTHCYFKRVHQFEIAQEDIVSSFEKYECPREGTQEMKND